MMRCVRGGVVGLFHHSFLTHTKESKKVTDKTKPFKGFFPLNYVIVAGLGCPGPELHRRLALSPGKKEFFALFAFLGLLLVYGLVYYLLSFEKLGEGCFEPSLKFSPALKSGVQSFVVCEENRRKSFPRP